MGDHLKRGKNSRDTLISLIGKSGARSVKLTDRCFGLQGDSRTLLIELPDESVDCVITSPPYGDQKDYGSAKEIGAGDKSHDDYLLSLKAVFSELFRCAKKGSALWIVVDTIKRGGESIPLPWQIIELTQSVGWRFQDTVIWDKGKSLPWSHSGHFRGVCEFVLLLSKGPLKTFRLDAIRESDHLSSYWVKYPERYHPLGKAPSDLWHYPIPVQGSWSKAQMRHYCPFPHAMVSRMVELTTRQGAVVLDPFAGTFSVPIAAASADRVGIGIDINKKFVDVFEKEGKAEIQKLVSANAAADGESTLSSLITGLRILKAPKSLFVGLSRADRLGAKARDAIAAMLVHVPRPRRIDETTSTVTLEVLVRQASYASEMQSEALRLFQIPPLSKFGLEFSLKIVSPREWLSDEFVSSLPDGKWFSYSNGVFNYFKQEISHEYFAAALRGLSQQVSTKYPPIFSNIERRIESGLS